MTLPILLSSPHAGTVMPPEVESYNILSEKDLLEDGDEGAAEIYTLADEVDAYVTTSIARAAVDLNRPTNDRRSDGVVKTHTCWEVPIYREPLPEAVVTDLLEKYYHPYHRRLTELAGKVKVAIDCHTMAAKGPPIGPDPGQERPAVCLSNAEGVTCPTDWLMALAECLETTLGQRIAINEPFKGGHITRSHASEVPWIQLEYSRAPFVSNEEKRARLLEALQQWAKRVFG